MVASTPSEPPVLGGATAPAPSSKKLHLWHNIISLFGLFVAAGSLLLIVTFAIFVVITPTHNPYVDVIGYMVLPAVLVGGLLIVPLGMWLQFRAMSKKGFIGRWIGGLRFDLSNPNHLRIALGFVALNIFAILPVIGVSGYHGYHYTESTEFCSNVCHAVMEPQAVAHESSPHARVACAECHIGSGAGWFVKSKLSGLGQVIAVMRDSFQRPIPPAITDLRPARETCEQCHWPAKFFGSQLKETVHYSPDEKNTRRVVRMVLKTGGADETTGRIEGIHMHMALSGPIEYVASDPHLQDIPWVRYVNPKGVETIYRSDGKPSTAPPPEGIVRRVDCMDCHNRGAHHFRPPEASVDYYLDAGLIDPTPPFIKREAVAALADAARETADASAIAERLRTFYERQYPQVWRERKEAVEDAATRIADIHRKIFFPFMHVDWMSYPDNIGHKNSSGCFRCHDGKHIDAAGRPLPSDCDICHTFLNPVEQVPGALVEGAFQHSMSLNLHEKLRCEQCHAGGPLPTCRDCHESGEWLDHYGKGLFHSTQRDRGRGQDAARIPTP